MVGIRLQDQQTRDDKPNAGLILAHRLRRSANIKPALDHRLLFTLTENNSVPINSDQWEGVVGSYHVGRHICKMGSQGRH